MSDGARTVVAANETAAIRPFATADAGPIDALLRTVWGHDPTMLRIYRGAHRDWPAGAGLIRPTLVAVAGGVVVGAGSLFESTIHPRMLFVTINVHHEWQRRGIGSALFNALERRGDGRPWLAKVTRRDRAGMAFLGGRGFRPIVSTLTGLLDPRDEPVRAWLTALPPPPTGCRVIPFDDRAGGTTLAEVALVHAAVYRQFHAWDPPAEVDAEMALARFCGPDVVAGSQLCAFAGDRLVGAANLIANPSLTGAGEAYLVNIGVTDDEPDAYALTAALIRRSVEFAAESGLRVRFEADDTTVPHRALFERSPATEVDRDTLLVANGPAR